MPPGQDRDFRLADRLALTLGEAAQRLGVSERHLRSCLHDLPHVHIGRRVVIPVDALREWLRQRAQSERSQADQVASEILRSLRGD